MATLFEKLTLEPENLASIRDAVMETFFKDEDFNTYVNVRKVRNGDPIALIGAMDMVGKVGGGCDPTYEEKGLANSMERWKLGDWDIPIKICYESVNGTIGEYALNTGTEFGDLTNTDIMAIYTDLLNRAVRQMIWRLGWFGDTKASNVADGGKITDGLGLDYFKVCDGLFKRIFNACTDNPAQKTDIAANSEASTAKQKSAILEKSVATGLVDKILMDADSRILDDSNAVLMMTRSLADALTYDIKKTYSNIMPWEKVFDGFDVANYNGVKIARISIWDRMIAANEKGTATLNLPFRAVLANPRNLMVGTDADSLLSNLDIWFDKKERRNYIYAQGTMGTALLESKLIHAAY